MKKKYESIFAVLFIVLSFFSCKKANMNKSRNEPEQTEMDSIHAEQDNSQDVKIEKEKKYVYTEGNDLPAYTDFFFCKNLPIGCKVVISNENCIFKTPSDNGDRDEDFYNDEIVTVSQIAFPGKNHNPYQRENLDSYWIKIVSDDYESAWTQSENLRMLSENPNPLTMTSKWHSYGSYGASFSPDGKYVCLKQWGAHNGTAGPLHIHDVESGDIVTEYMAAGDYDADSSEYTVFSKDSKWLFFEENLNLYKINVETKEVVSFGSPTNEHGELSNMYISKDGKKILYIYSWSNAGINASVYSMSDDKWTNYYKSGEADKLEEEYRDYKSGQFNFNMANIYRHSSDIAYMPEKNLVIAAANRRDEMFSCLYFFEYNTGKFIKAENPIIESEDTHLYVDSFTVNADGTKIAVRVKPGNARVTNNEYYICDLNLENLTPTVPENLEDQKYMQLKNDMNYLCSYGFRIVNSEGDYVSLINFNYDNTFCAINDPNGDPCYGSYTLEQVSSNGKTLVDFKDLVTRYYEGSIDYYEPYLHKGYIEKKIYDFDTIGGITYTDDCQRFIECLQQTEPYKTYWYKGREVIKYPVYDDAVRIEILENLKMREEPSVNGDVIYFPYHGTVNGIEINESERNTVYAGQRFCIMAASTHKDTIDGITSPWYLIRVYSDEYADLDTEVREAWIFGGYTRILED